MVLLTKDKEFLSLAPFLNRKYKVSKEKNSDIRSEE